MSDLPHQKILDEEQQLLELFNLESSKLRILRTAQAQEAEERQELLDRQKQQEALESTTKKINSIIARASKEDEEEETQVIIFNYEVILTAILLFIKNIYFRFTR